MTTKTKVADLKLSDIKTVENVRTVTDKGADVELANSIEQHGILEPVIVRKKNNQFILVSGYRRLAAVKSLKLKSIPASIMDLTEEQALEVQLVENIQRANLSPLDEAEGFISLVNRGLAVNEIGELWAHREKGTLISDALKAKIKDVATRTGKSANAVTRSVRLLELEKPILNWMREGKLTILHGNLLLMLTKEDRARCIKDHLNFKVRCLGSFDKHSYPVSELEGWIESNTKRDLSTASWDLKATGEEMKLDKNILSCVACPSNTGNQGALFDGATKGSCLTPSCFKKKKARGYSLQREIIAAKKPWKDLKFVGYASANMGFPTTIKGFSVVQEPSKQFIKAVEAKPDAFGWGMVKISKTAKPVHVVIDEKALPKKAQTKKPKGETATRFDPKAAFIQEHVNSEFVGLADKLLLKLKDKQLAEFLSSHGQRMYGWDDAASVLFAEKGKAPKKMTVSQVMMVMLRMILSEDSLDWGDIFKILGGDFKKIEKTLKIGGFKAWEQKLLDEKTQKKSDTEEVKASIASQDEA